MIVTKTPQARRDLIELADFIAQDSPDAAMRFLDAAQDAFNLLLGMPEMGTRCQFQNPQATDIRVWSIRGFDDYLVFYRPTNAGIDVVRVLHGSRNIPALFAEVHDE